MKTTLVSLGVLLAILAASFAINAVVYEERPADGGLVADYKNATYFISGNPVTLVNGVSKVPAAPDSPVMNITRYFGNEVRGDLDGDLDEDVVFLMTYEPANTGPYFFLAGAINENGKYRGTQAMLIGESIAPQTTQHESFSGIPGGYVIVNYAVGSNPSEGKSLYAKYASSTNDFGELVRDFEGESR